MGWLKDWFDTDFSGDHRDGDSYEANVEFDDSYSRSSLFGQYTLSIYRVRNGKRGQNPVHTEVRKLDASNYTRRRQVERELERFADDWVAKQHGTVPDELA